jgi:hypothetical protein
MNKPLFYLLISQQFQKVIFLLLVVLFSIIGYAQPCDPLTVPTIFSGGRGYISCRSTFLNFGVSNSKTNQVYYFSTYKNGIASRKGGPLDGNGGGLSVAAFLRSAQDAGEYRITTFNNCGDSASYSFYVFSGNIDNLSIAGWGSNAVTIRWAACGPRPAVTYEYAITTEANPNLTLSDRLTTTDTSVSKNGLIPGTIYYVHVRVKSVFLDEDPFITNGTCDADNLPWETIRFVSCSGAPPVGSITPVNAFVCVGGTVGLTASGGNTYSWFDGNNTQIPGANSSIYNPSSAGQYRVYITTSAGCEGLVSSALVIDTLLHTGNFFGGGVYCLGDSVKLGITNTIVSQTYTIRRDGQDVQTLQGIGNPNEQTSPDTLWYKFKINSAAQAGTYTIRTANPWCSNGLDFGNVTVSTSSTAVTGLTAANVTDGSVNFSWTYPASWVNKFEYAVTTSATPPASGTLTTNLYSFADALTASTTYRIHVRPVCGQGSLPWTTISFTTLSAYVLCSSTPAISTCTPVTRYLPAGTGNASWNFGTNNYPDNSAGGPTPGRERVFSFTPSQAGVYYLDVIAVTGPAIHYLYKLSSVGCNATGWTGIRAISTTGKYPIGMLQAGTPYLFVLDNSSNTLAASQTFKICRAQVATPSQLNNCINTMSLPGTIPAFSSKEEYVIDEAGNLIASIDFSSMPVSQSDVSVSYNAGNLVRKDKFNREYMDRSLSINWGGYSLSTAKIKLFFTDDELLRLINEVDDGIADVTSVSDLKVSRFNSTCSNYLYDINDFSDQTGNGVYDAGSHYVAFNSAADYYANSYYLHGGNAALDYYKNLTYIEDFEQAIFPSGWSQKFDTGSYSLSLVTASANPTTTPFGQPRFINWGSYNWPIGSETKLISPPLSTSGLSRSNLSVEFYWFNNNRTIYSTGHYLNEGVQVQYSFNGTDWVNAGAFIPRHDGSLAAGTGQWKKKSVALPVIEGNYDFVYIAFKFRSEFGDNCSLDSVTFKQAPGCDNIISGLATTAIASNSVNFSWAPVAGVMNYEYIVMHDPYPPYSGTLVTGTSTSVGNLDMSTSYYIHVRPQCTPGLFGAWSTIQFTTPAGPDHCLGIPIVGICSTQTVTIPAGTGEWDFTGDYPVNSAGWSTPGREQVYSFTPDESGVYYIEILNGSSDGWVDFFYKPASSGCNNRDWTGIDDVWSTGRRAIDWLYAGQTYLILIDNESTSAITKMFKICKANVVTATTNTCIGTVWLPNSIPANNPKTEYFLDNNGNLLAGVSFYSISNAVGSVGLSYYINGGPVRRDVMSREYLDRNFTITSTTAPANVYHTWVGVSLFFTNAELQRLIDEPDDGIADVQSVGSLNVTRELQNCSGNFSDGLSRFIYSNDRYQYDGSSSYVRFSTKLLGSFFIHGGSEALGAASNIVCPSAGSTSFYFSGSPGQAMQWQVDNGSGFQNISNNNIYSGATTQYLALSNPPTSFNGYKYRCVLWNQYYSDTSDVKTLKFIVNWKGSVSSSWHNPANWDCGVVPDANTDVIINSYVNPPVISTNVSCRSIIAKPGTNVTVATGAKLTITGK